MAELCRPVCAGRHFFCSEDELIGTLGYVVLMHHWSPVARLGHRGRWIHLQMIQRRLFAARKFPLDGHEVVMWSHLIGHRRFVTPIPVLARVCGSVYVQHPGLSGYLSYLKWRLAFWKTWLGPAQQQPSQAQPDAGSCCTDRRDR